MTVAIDFDGVIHKYSRGWLDGKIYDEPVDGAFEFIQYCVENCIGVFIFSTRSPRQIKKWLIEQCSYAEDIDYHEWIYKFRPVIIPFWKKFWNEVDSSATMTNPAKIGISKRKLPANIYVDDRAFKFDNNWDILKDLLLFIERKEK
jgi:hypothetical protein